ncbi:hypothetical protein [Nesterenkonia ebinurensis]|uniref:hypothetical protein n=1 Tax=Nesterenkonia ebinurensis TaxID=2608252 RepID=UPI00123D386D|nr:hypothetical protein [Nesterenkonia ebinurensis]
MADPEVMGGDHCYRRSPELVLPKSVDVGRRHLTWGFAVLHVGGRRSESVDVEQNGHHNGHHIQQARASLKASPAPAGCFS